VASEHVILLHGLWMRAFAMGLLRRRLIEQGFEVHRFEYMSVAGTPERAIVRLQRKMRELAPGPVHLVGHSLGGMLALLACVEDDLPEGRIVCLGSPLAGSAAARGLIGHWGGDRLLGNARELLEHGFESWDGPREVVQMPAQVVAKRGALTHESLAVIDQWARSRFHPHF